MDTNQEAESGLEPLAITQVETVESAHLDASNHDATKGFKRSFSEADLCPEGEHGQVKLYSPKGDLTANAENSTDIDITASTAIVQKKSRSTKIEETTQAWRQSYPCWAKNAVFFFSARANNQYNSQNHTFSQACRKILHFDEHTWVSAYHYYSYEKALVIKEFNLRRKRKLQEYNFTASDVPRMIKDHDGGILEAIVMREIIYGFKWTQEAEAAWDSKAPLVTYKANFLKAVQWPKFREALLGTGDKLIIKSCDCECKCGTHYNFPNAVQNRRRWGPNLLGKTLMKLRSDLRDPRWSELSYPPPELLAEASSIHSIDDGRSHECDRCVSRKMTVVQGEDTTSAVFDIES